MPRHYYKDIVLELKPEVYEPLEDSELLAEAVEKEIVIARRILGNGMISFLDLGCGSGLIAIVAAKAGVKVTAVDISKEAVELTERNAKSNNVLIECMRSDLLDSVNGKFDIIAFNAPYLPEEAKKGNQSWAAGENLQIIRRAVEQVKGRLNPNGVLMMAISSLTGVGKVGKLLESSGFSWQTAAERKVPWERLLVLKAVL